MVLHIERIVRQLTVNEVRVDPRANSPEIRFNECRRPVNLEKKLISVVIPCYNEEANIVPLCNSITEIIETQLQQYDYEIIISDNKSEDRTREYLRELASKNHRIKVLLNDRNYGGGSMQNALLYSSGDVTIIMYADFQDPPELIPKYIEHWEEGYKIIPAVRSGSEESKIISLLRGLFYRLAHWTSGLNIIHHFSGTGGFDKEFIDLCKRHMRREWNMRFFVAKYGTGIKEVKFVQPLRKGGKSSNSFFSLVDQASNFIMEYLNRKSPMLLALMSLIGIGFSSIAGVGYFIMKLTHWDSFQAGIAPLLLLLFFFMFIQNILFAEVLALLFTLEKQACGEGWDLKDYYNREGRLSVYIQFVLRFSSFFEKYHRYLPVVGIIGLLGVLMVLFASLMLKMTHWKEHVLGITPAVITVSLLLGMMIIWAGIIYYHLYRLSIMLNDTQNKIPFAVVEEKLNFD